LGKNRIRRAKEEDGQQWRCEHRRKEGDSYRIPRLRGSSFNESEANRCKERQSGALPNEVEKSPGNPQDELREQSRVRHCLFPFSCSSSICRIRASSFFEAGRTLRAPIRRPSADPPKTRSIKLATISR
jgi:hypothetical protein